MPRLGANQLVLRFGLQSPLGPGSCVPRSLAAMGARTNSGLAARIGTRLISKGWSRFMHETLHHKLNSAIMAWYAGGGFFLFLFLTGPRPWLRPTGRGTEGIVHTLEHSVCNTNNLQPLHVRSTMCDVSNEREIFLPKISRVCSNNRTSLRRDRGGTDYPDALSR